MKNNLFPWKISAKSNPWKTKSKAWKKKSTSIHEKPGPCEKIEKKLVRKTNSAPWQFFHQGQERGFKLSPVLISNWLVRFGEKIWPVKKYHTREDQQFLTCEKISNPWKFPKFFPWKINFNPWKNLKKYPWKLSTTREILGKTTREKYFLPVKKTRKRAKKRFHGFFWFSRGKKKHWSYLVPRYRR